MISHISIEPVFLYSSLRPGEMGSFRSQTPVTLFGGLRSHTLAQPYAHAATAFVRGTSTPANSNARPRVRCFSLTSRLVPRQQLRS